MSPIVGVLQTAVSSIVAWIFTWRTDRRAVEAQRLAAADRDGREQESERKAELEGMAEALIDAFVFKARENPSTDTTPAVTVATMLAWPDPPNVEDRPVRNPADVHALIDRREAEAHTLEGATYGSRRSRTTTAIGTSSSARPATARTRHE